MINRKEHKDKKEFYITRHVIGTLTTSWPTRSNSLELFAPIGKAVKSGVPRTQYILYSWSSSLPKEKRNLYERGSLIVHYSNVTKKIYPKKIILTIIENIPNLCCMDKHISKEMLGGETNKISREFCNICHVGTETNNQDNTHSRWPKHERNSTTYRSVFQIHCVLGLLKTDFVQCHCNLQ